MTQFSMMGLVSCLWVFASLKVLIHARFSPTDPIKCHGTIPTIFSDRYILSAFSCRVSILIVPTPCGFADTVTTCHTVGPTVM